MCSHSLLIWWMGEVFWKNELCTDRVKEILQLTTTAPVPLAHKDTRTIKMQELLLEIWRAEREKTAALSCTNGGRVCWDTAPQSICHSPQTFTEGHKTLWAGTSNREMDAVQHWAQLSYVRSSLETHWHLSLPPSARRGWQCCRRCRSVSPGRGEAAQGKCCACRAGWQSSGTGLG